MKKEFWTLLDKYINMLSTKVYQYRLKHKDIIGQDNLIIDFDKFLVRLKSYIFTKKLG